ncbi:MAG TPA: ComEC/Rec2 family competence protein [Alphaproteobacteria bacterium]
MSTFVDQWTPHRDRVLWAPVLFGAGIALYFSLNKEPGIGQGLLLLTLCLCVFLGIWRRFPAFFFAAGALLMLAAGFNAALLRTHMVAAPQITRDVGPTMVTGTVLDITVADENDGKSKRKVLLGSLTVDRLTPENTPTTIRLTSSHIPADIGPGDYIQILAKLMPPSGPVVPDGFNYRRDAFFNQIGAVGFTLGKFELLEKGQPGAVTQWFNALRQKIAIRINTVLPAPESGVATAMLAGERAAIPEGVNQDLIDSGLYHLLSISGLHVAIVCGVTFFVLRFGMALFSGFALRYPIKKFAAGSAMMIGILYMLLAGAPVPTQRAMLMTGIMLLAVMLDRSVLSLRTIAIAALIVLILHPEALIGASFQLSFAAVLAMIAFYEGIGRDWFVAHRDRNIFSKVLLYFTGIAITTMLVSFATLPATLHHFGRLQLLGVIGNAAAIPLTTFIVMPFGMLGIFLMPFGIQGPFLRVAGWGTDAMLDIAHWVAHLPHAVLALPGLPTGYFIVASLGYLFLAFWHGHLRWIGVPVMVIAIGIGMIAPRAQGLIDRDMRSLGIKGEREIAYALKSPSAYTRKNWLAYWGGTEFQNGKPVKADIWQSGDMSMVCDDWACRVTSQGRNLSIVKSASALHDECDWASLVIIKDKAAYDMTCNVPHINGWDIRDAGGYALHIDKDEWIAVPFTEAAERRPWTALQE